MIRRPIIAACLCTVALGASGCSGGSKGSNGANAAGTNSGATATSTTSKNGSTGNGTPTTMHTGVASRTLRPVGVGQPAELAHSLFASVTQVTPTTLTAQAPGETTGPGVFVTIKIRNDTDAVVDLDTLAVNAHYGNRVPTTPIRLPAGALHGSLRPGASKTARYAFRVPKDQARSVRVDIQHSAAPNVVIVDVDK